MTATKTTRCPFTILIDSAEQHPFPFQQIAADAGRQYRLFDIPTERKWLGIGKADYCIAGMEGRCHIERKSMADAASTLLGWSEHPRFERTLSTLAAMDCSAVVVECSIGSMVNYVATQPQRGQKTPAQNAKSAYRQTIAWMQDFRTPWYWCDDRRMAEITTFRIMYRYYKKAAAASRHAERLARVLAARREADAAANVNPRTPAQIVEFENLTIDLYEPDNNPFPAF
jgi:hypothetical protein